jgi:hypothetical protein
MKTIRSSLLLLTLPLLLVALFAGTSAAAGDDKSDFRNGFEQAMAINSKQEMQRLLREYDVEAVNWILETAETIAASPNDKVFERMNHLREAWKKVHLTDFCEKMEKYFSLLSGPQKRERMRVKGEYDKQLSEYFANLEKKEQSAFGVLAGEFRALAEAFTEVGDLYYASQCWNLVGHCFDEPNRGDDAVLQSACAGYGKCIETRDQIGLTDKLYKTTKPRYERLVALGYGPAQPPGEGGAPQPVEAAASVTVTMGFELIDDPSAFERPNYFIDDHYSIWNSIILAGKGSQADIPRLQDGPKALRESSAKVFVDVDLDGAGDVEVPLRGSPMPIEFEIGDGAARRKWAFLAIVGIEQDLYQGVQMNLSPQDGNMSIYTIPAGSMVGAIGGVPVRVIDENMNGEYGDFFQINGWGHVGLTADHYQPEVDSMIIGDGKRAVPFSEYQKIGDQWYKLEVQNGGTGIIATPEAIQTGFLKLSYKGLTPGYVVVRGSNKYENSFFDLAGARGKPVEVPIGRYELFFGAVSKGKKKQSVKACMLPGSNTRKWSVASGETAEIELGAPFGFDAKFEVNGDELLVLGDTVVVTGVGDERYERPYQCRPQPEVSWRKKGSKRGSKGEKMKLLGSSDEVETHGYKQAWFPYDLTIELKGDVDEVEIQLVDKKNKLFGKVESEWLD